VAFEEPEVVRHQGALALDLVHTDSVADGIRRRVELLEDALEATMGNMRRAQWLEENEAAITAYNQQVENRGVFSDGWRRF